MSIYQYKLEDFLSKSITEDEDFLYEMAKSMYRHTFLIIRPDAEDVPEELLGEVVKAKDFFFPSSETEPLFEVDGYDGFIPMSMLSICG